MRQVTDESSKSDFSKTLIGKHGIIKDGSKSNKSGQGSRSKSEDRTNNIFAKKITE
jgi:hypothetical protein